uniref:Uncharacterized protein n=2 Tax=Heterosigma akashiwo TaxID=2829 RepID=A0A6V2STP8_HETAK|mmetsp:Transcript_17350/g.33004  ORF Transcript_17350/g.33004 Transcript_17350/m.33004 type:complete len:1056 (+) Transcript_17350:94-3261(+)|eukprot:CAMPEP_0206381110 /NCGR_PEP_ID=MMETSP0294-20121207/12451_1 /ASSEMBLY_ACC=CAM_ASM_000327 /TAXON_ID=39354 /ORGANISM="Heterosigma akashiwo, Strain CCMP2393" /LENGTH=1055 /DNA_ID=CAMNT_0053830501 /DNA_START=87 /DNA_END=3254 /DNA_ORIENTATION=-
MAETSGNMKKSSLAMLTIASLAAMGEAFVHPNNNGFAASSKMIKPMGYAQRQTIRNFVEQKPEDAFSELIEEGTKLQKAARKLPSEAQRLILPSALKLQVAPAALAEVVREKGLEELSEDDLEEVRDRFGLEGEAWERVLVELYRRFAAALLDASPAGEGATTAEVKRLAAVHARMGMSGSAVSQAHFEAARELRAQLEGGLFGDVEDKASAAYLKLSKFLFLTDRVLHEAETPEAKRFEMGRVRRALDLSREQLAARLAEQANPLYRKAMAQVPAKIAKVKPQTMENARKALGVVPADMFDMHLEFYQEELEKLVHGKYKSDFSTTPWDEADQLYLAKLGVALTLRPEFCDELYAEVVGPLYQAALKQHFPATTSTQYPPGLAETTAHLNLPRLQREKELKQFAREPLRAMWRKATGGDLLNNEAATDEQIIKMLEWYGRVKSLVNASFANAEVANAATNRIFQNVLVSDDELERQAELRTYKNFVKRRTLKYNEGDAVYFSDMVFLLGAEPVEWQKDVKKMSGGELRMKLYAMHRAGKCKGDGDSGEAKFELMKETKGMDRDEVDRVFRQVGLELYRYSIDELKRKWGDVPSARAMQDLLDLKTWFQLRDSDTDAVHLDKYGDVYAKAVVEAMGPAGKVEAEAKPLLRELAKRLLLDEKAERFLWKKALCTRAEPLVESLLNSWDMVTLSREGLAKKRGTDYGADLIQAEGSLGIAAEASIVPDLVALAQLFEDNEGLTSSVVEVRSPTGQPETKTVWRAITSVNGMFEGENEKVEQIYRSFLVQAHSDAKRDAAALSKLQEQLPAVLGIPASRVVAIKASMGEGIVDRFFANYFVQNPAARSLDPQGLFFLAQIQTQLGMTDAEFDEVTAGAKRKVAVARKADLFEGGALNAARAQAFRELCQGLGEGGLLGEEGGLLSKAQRRQLFALEVGAAVEGRAGADALAEAAEACMESYGLNEADSQVALLALFKLRFAGLMRVAAKNLEDGFRQRAGDGLDRVVAFGLVTPEPMAHAYPPAKVADLVACYGEFLEKKGDGEAGEKLETLKLVLGA